MTSVNVAGGSPSRASGSLKAPGTRPTCWRLRGAGANRGSPSNSGSWLTAWQRKGPSPRQGRRRQPVVPGRVPWGSHARGRVYRVRAPPLPDTLIAVAGQPAMPGLPTVGGSSPAGYVPSGVDSLAFPQRVGWMGPHQPRFRVATSLVTSGGTAPIRPSHRRVRPRRQTTRRTRLPRHRHPRPSEHPGRPCSSPASHDRAPASSSIAARRFHLGHLRAQFRVVVSSYGGSRRHTGPGRRHRRRCPGPVHR
jgi:hypothetical protein